MNTKIDVLELAEKDAILHYYVSLWLHQGATWQDTLQGAVVSLVNDRRRLIRDRIKIEQIINRPPGPDIEEGSTCL